MGVVGPPIDITDRNIGPRFSLPAKFVLVYIKIQLKKSASGSGNATIYVMRDDLDITGLFDFTELEIPSVDVDGEVFIRIAADEYPSHTYPAGTELVFVWDDPDVGSATTWGIEVGLADAARRTG
jgi:hypothetical protein